MLLCRREYPMSNSLENLFDLVFAGSWWSQQKEFPPCEDWKCEVEKYLQFMKNKDWLDLMKPQLQSRNYDSFLSEIFAAYFIENSLGFEVTRWNPVTTKYGHSVEFCIKDKSGEEIFCEVKSPGWKGQLSKEEIQHGRAKQNKFLLASNSRYTKPYHNIRQAVCKSYRKFLPYKQNLLIITDELFQPVSIGPIKDWGPHKMPMNIFYALYNTNKDHYGGLGYFKTKDYENLGGILFLNNRCPGKFFAWFEANPNAKISLSKEFASEVLTLNEKRIKCAQNDYIKHNGTD